MCRAMCPKCEKISFQKGKCHFWKNSQKNLCCAIATIECIQCNNAMEMAWGETYEVQVNVKCADQWRKQFPEREKLFHFTHHSCKTLQNEVENAQQPVEKWYELSMGEKFRPVSVEKSREMIENALSNKSVPPIIIEYHSRISNGDEEEIDYTDALNVEASETTKQVHAEVLHAMTKKWTRQPNLILVPRNCLLGTTLALCKYLHHSSDQLIFETYTNIILAVEKNIIDKCIEQMIKKINTSVVRKVA